jgi:phosphotriesterase-related protein
MSTRRQFVTRAVASGVAASLCGPFAGASGERGVVQTVLGPLDASKLGFTLTHEHIADAPGVLDRWPKAWGGRAGLIERAVARLEVIKAAGIGSVVDLTTHDVGRDVRFLEEVSRKSGVHLVASTGQRFLPPVSQVPMPARTIAGLAGFFTQEIEQGIEGTGIKAGAIKIGVNEGRPTALEEVGLRAAARASKAMGVPIRIHTRAAERAGESIAVILEDEGVNPARVCFDHSDDSGDMEYFLGLAGRGYFLSMDHVHRGLMPGFEPSFERRAECIRLLVEAGFARQLFISSDSEFGGSLLPEDARHWRENIDPPEGMLFAIRTLLPRLRELGVSSRHIHTITVENPRAFLGK